jgi:Ca2+/Na+ antiporter
VPAPRGVGGLCEKWKLIASAIIFPVNPEEAKQMNTKNNGLLMMVLAVILAVIALFANNLLVWLFWLSVVVMFGYGLYMFRQKQTS